jgi:molecular chaperone DnaK (HSP70)
MYDVGAGIIGFHSGNSSYSVQELIGMIFRQIKQHTESSYNEKIAGCVISVRLIVIIDLDSSILQSI